MFYMLKEKLKKKKNHVINSHLIQFLVNVAVTISCKYLVYLSYNRNCMLSA